MLSRKTVRGKRERAKEKMRFGVDNINIGQFDVADVAMNFHEFSATN